MNKNQIIGLCIAVFIAGDAEGIIRSRIAHRRLIKKLRLENEIAQMKVNALVTFMNDTVERADSIDEIVEKFMLNRQFIDTIEGSM